MFARFVKDESGATAIEYGLIVTFLFIAIVTAIHAYVNSTQGMYIRISDAVDGAVN